MPSRRYARYTFIISFSVRRGRCPQCLETVKRGDDPFEEAVDPSIVYEAEAYGGYVQARLLISHHSPVIKAINTNLLEDEDEELYVLAPYRLILNLAVHGVVAFLACEQSIALR